MKVCWYNDAINAGCSEVFDAQFCFVQVREHTISEDGNLSTCQTVRTAADESEVQGYIFRFLEPLSNLAPELGLVCKSTHSHAPFLVCLTQVCSVWYLTCVVTWKHIGVNCMLVDQQPWRFATVV